MESLVLRSFKNWRKILIMIIIGNLRTVYPVFFRNLRTIFNFIRKKSKSYSKIFRDRLIIKTLIISKFILIGAIVNNQKIITFKIKLLLRVMEIIKKGESKLLLVNLICSLNSLRQPTRKTFKCPLFIDLLNNQWP